jgi:hypothetical protein
MPRAAGGRGAGSEIMRERFAYEYLVDLNRVNALKRAGYRGSEGVLKGVGFRLMRDPKVREIIREAQRERLKRASLTQDKVLAELMRIGFLDPGELFDEQGRLLHISMMPKDVRKAIASIEVVTYTVPSKDEPAVVEYTHKIKFSPKDKALDTLTRHINVRDAFPQKVEMAAPEGIDVNHRYSEEDRKLLKDLAVALAKRKVEDAASGS